MAIAAPIDFMGARIADSDLAAARECAQLIVDALSIPALDDLASELRVQALDVLRSLANGIPYLAILDLPNLALDSIPGSPIRVIRARDPGEAAQTPWPARAAATEILQPGQLLRSPTVLAEVRFQYDVLVIRADPGLSAGATLRETSTLAQLLARNAKVALVVPPGSSSMYVSETESALGLVSPLVIECGGSIANTIAAVGNLEDATLWAMRGNVRRLESLLASTQFVRERVEHLAARREREIAALNITSRERLADLDNIQRTLAHHVRQGIDEVTAVVATTPWTTASLEQVLLADNQPSLDPRPIVRRIDGEAVLDMKLVEPTDITAGTNVIFRDCTFLCEIRKSIAETMAQEVRRQLTAVLESTRAELNLLRTNLANWIHAIPSRWTGPLEPFNSLTLPAFYGHDLEKEISVTTMVPKCELPVVIHGLWHQLWHGSGMGKLVTSFFGFLITTGAFFILLEKNRNAGVPVGPLWYLGTVLSLLFIFFLIPTLIRRPKDRKRNFDEISAQFRRGADAHVCRLFQQFEEKRVASIKSYLVNVQQRIVDQLNACVDEARSAESSRTRAVATGRKEVERIRKQVEGTGVETPSQRLMDAMQRVSALRRSIDQKNLQQGKKNHEQQPG